MIVAFRMFGKSVAGFYDIKIRNYPVLLSIDFYVQPLSHSLWVNMLLAFFSHAIMYCIPGNYYSQISNRTRLLALTIVFIILQILSHSVSVCLVRLKDLNCHLHREALSLECLPLHILGFSRGGPDTAQQSRCLVFP